MLEPPRRLHGAVLADHMAAMIAQARAQARRLSAQADSVLAAGRATASLTARVQEAVLALMRATDPAECVATELPALLGIDSATICAEDHRPGAAPPARWHRRAPVRPARGGVPRFPGGHPPAARRRRPARAGGRAGAAGGAGAAGLGGPGPHAVASGPGHAAARIPRPGPWRPRRSDDRDGGVWPRSWPGLPRNVGPRR